MDIRTQVAMVFHLDKCIGCHTCSISCKNLWTDREGQEYAWWNNVETKPGTGYPYQWENQENYKGGWVRDEENDVIHLKMSKSRFQTLRNIFYNKDLPQIDDYYEPWTYKYDDLNCEEKETQPVARPVSKITGEPMDPEYGPNWDDELAGSEKYAKKDMNLENLSEEEKDRLHEVEQLVYFYLPRMCNHCVNPSCVASCPSGAIYKRGEDGIVLANQETCRGWRMCVSGCPYQKVYYNWKTGKSEKCILCYPRLESGQAPACFHTCVGRIRYLGVLLYDNDALLKSVSVDDDELVDAIRSYLIKDPNDPEVIAEAKANGISDSMIEAAQNSPVYKFVMDWQIALPLHAEFRTLPMLFYVPPLLPIIGEKKDGSYDVLIDDQNSLHSMLSSLEKARIPVKYMASLFAAGNERLMEDVYEKLVAVRAYTRAKEIDDVDLDDAKEALEIKGISEQTARDIVRLTAKPTYQERFVLLPLGREMDIEALEDPLSRKEMVGLGFSRPPRRGG